MKLKELMKSIKLKIQFKRFQKGYWDGYSQGCKRCLVANGTFLVVKVTDINVYSEFSKHPPKSRAWTYRPWRAGFEYGYAEAISFYDSGESPTSNDDSFYEQDIRIKLEFEKLKEDF